MGLLFGHARGVGNAQQRRGRAFWTGVVDEFEVSDQTQWEFCQQRQLGLSSLRQWLHRLRKERSGAESSGTVAQFVPLVASTARRAGDECRVRVGCTEICFSTCPSPQYLVQLIELIER